MLQHRPKTACLPALKKSRKPSSHSKHKSSQAFHTPTQQTGKRTTTARGAQTNLANKRHVHTNTVQAKNDQQTALPCKAEPGSAGRKGVTWDNKKGKWRVRVQNKHFGYFASQAEAIQVSKRHAEAIPVSKRHAEAIHVSKRLREDTGEHHVPTKPDNGLDHRVKELLDHRKILLGGSEHNFEFLVRPSDRL